MPPNRTASDIAIMLRSRRLRPPHSSGERLLESNRSRERQPAEVVWLKRSLRKRAGDRLVFLSAVALMIGLIIRALGLT
jgi:hypothetical protein